MTKKLVSRTCSIALHHFISCIKQGEKGEAVNITNELLKTQARQNNLTQENVQQKKRIRELEGKSAKIK